MLLPIPASIIRAGKLRDMTSRLCPKTESHAKGLDSPLSQVLYGIAFDRSDTSRLLPKRKRDEIPAQLAETNSATPAPQGEMEVPPDPLQIADLTGGGGWTRTNDLRIMRPSL